ncbi:hypothetical protein ASPWEDRAFT_735754 [Aspergillus wentii DTO 134E9]|uniref:BZIP domain-containing protein n=1 Tax=Aspergillus wentii DTO 134E9 TaxID=1073089 RepID=A0A1L9RW03_ASPWE|nr:uncharacterized protein ASPWEDRAFT_735754 [Aspergillus wentii DTO 134E9]OJJ39028.1 hypothetical protein ASPWEDRAFT_735754 [Aspergillus wentii DTO 134E9]
MDYSYYNGAQTQPFSLYGLHGIPTPDQNQTPHATDDLQDPFSSLSFGLNPGASFVPPPHSPPESFSKHSVSSNDAANHPTDPASADGGDDQLMDQGGRSDSEEKDGSVPAQSKRKAQNRAAQRAFRERKERHVKELEQKVDQLEQSSTRLQADNERLKQQLAKFSTENEILRATSHNNNNNATGNSNHRSDPEPTTTGPMEYSPTDFYSTLIPDGEPNARHRITVCQKTGERLFDAGATWDLIQGHELFKRGLVDIADVSERLKSIAQCDGQGPAFREGAIRSAIEESAANGNDELI